MAVYIVLFGFIVIMGLVNQKYENKYNNVYSIICIVLILIGKYRFCRVEDR